MALVGKLETRPTSTTSWATFRVLVTRCLLCGYRTEQAVRGNYIPPDDYKIIPKCGCYDSVPVGPLQPVRIIPND
jgi:hypothetical protein